ncbi:MULTISPECIES: hypothetical protein [unclassified Streptomyces]|uniref:hypothetical protein n=1 Tax=unclassified Streptomyces TaxID=2593676 RepID=UPI0035DDFE4E
MSLFDPGSDGSRRVVVAEHPSYAPLRVASARLRRRLLTVNASVALLVFLLAYTPGGRATGAVLGEYTLGMLLLSVQATTLLLSALWYDRACAALCDPHVNALRAATHSAGPGREQL